MKRLEGRVAFITGGARGQGRAIAAKFAAEGADVVISDICGPIDSVPYALGSRDDLDATRAIVEGAGRRCIAEVVDVRDADALRALAERASSELGAIDVVCANAGILSFAPFWEMDAQQWQDMIDVNLTGVFNTVKAVAPAMIAAQQGSIILTSSVNGAEGGDSAAHYSAAKHGVIGLMRSFALALGPHNIRVNAVQPGPIMTGMTDNDPMRREVFGRDDATNAEMVAATRSWHILRGRPALPATAVADAMIWLASDESRHVTGLQMPVDAGHLITPGFNTQPIDDPALGTFDYDDHALRTREA